MTQSTATDLMQRVEHALQETKTTMSDESVIRFINMLNNGDGRREELVSNLDLQLCLKLGKSLRTQLDNCPEAEQAACRKQIHEFLNAARRSELLTRVYKAEMRDAWFDLLLELIESSQFATGRMLLQRVQEYGEKPVFKTIKGRNVTNHSWRELQSRIFGVAKGLLTAMAEISPGSEPCRVAVLSDNNLDMVCIDLACLACGIVDVPMPTNATPQTLQYILEHSDSRILFVSGNSLVSEIMQMRQQLEHLQLIVALNTTELPKHDKLISFGEFLARGAGESDGAVMQAIERVRIDDLATIMYTSGTTEMPKGIRFSQRNIVSKRFARAIALPEIGDNDRFICYLPLFHTFGRYFEMVGAIFWGASYIFIENPKIDTIIENMRLTRPTVFISIPKKWMQLYEKVAEHVDVEHAPLAELRPVVHDLTGGRLRWGLSAAGYLDPDVFRFFQHNGIELMSGFGMTEATGGITMTPPFEYRSNSVGKPLPGIEVKLAEDGEMLIRGPYVMEGYLNEETTGLESGWLHTGDIFRADKDGHLEIIDRKKEIYKNLQGETISPQKIENLFTDFEAVRSVFLVGDHRAYNTLLLYPNYDYEQVALSKLNRKELREFFGSIIVSINQFLASFERIVNFAIIERDFSAEHGELTAKGTYKRKAIERNFETVIDEMYQENFVPLTVGGFKLRVPTWFLRQKGLTSDDLQVDGGAVIIKPSGISLPIKRQRTGGRNHVRIGDLVYLTREPFLDLSEIVRNPALWLGNLALSEFVGENMIHRAAGRSVRETEVGLSLPKQTRSLPRRLVTRLNQLMTAGELSVQGVHLAAYVVQTWQERPALRALNYLQTVFEQRDERTLNLVKLILMRTAESRSVVIKRRAFQILMQCEQRNLLRPVLETFLLAKHRVLNRETIDLLSANDFSQDQLRSILGYVSACLEQITDDPTEASRYPVRGMLRFITAYGIKHPAAYRQVRAELVRWQLFGPQEHKQHAENSFATLQKGFRKWLGANLQIAIDPETMREFRWNDVLVFDETIPENDQQIIASAIKNCPLVREAIFLFSSRIVSLHEIARNGVYIGFLGARHGKAVYRVSVQTQHHGSFDLAINLNKSRSQQDVLSEINWLICAGASGGNNPLVEEFGGFWPEYGLWTEEFIPGDTVEKYLRKIHRQTARDAERLQYAWPSFVWNGLSAYVDFWNRTGRRYQIADPTPANVIVPTHDFQVGFRIVSISSRKRHHDLIDMILSFRHDFVLAVESQYENLKGKCSWHVIFSAFLEILGEEQGLRLFQKALGRHKTDSGPETRELLDKLTEFIQSVSEKGYKPERLHFAIQRFKRWYALNPAATAQARIQTLRDLSTTYIIEQVERKYPGARIQFFRDTVFANSDPGLIDGLNQILRKLKRNEISGQDLPDHFAELRSQYDLSDDEQLFLTRLSYPHLGAEDAAEFVSLHAEGSEKTALVVFIEDNEGNQLAIREPANPKEVAKLHKLFTIANLPVEFTPEHRFLVVLGARGQVVGGMFYHYIDASHVHLEKVVVQERYRGREISDGLLKEFFNRLRSQGVEVLSVGFLRPSFFFKFGFRIDHRYGNMVKRLEVEENPEPLDELMPAI